MRLKSGLWYKLGTVPMSSYDKSIAEAIKDRKFKLCESQKRLDTQLYSSTIEFEDGSTLRAAELDVVSNDGLEALYTLFLNNDLVSGFLVPACDSRTPEEEDKINKLVEDINVLERILAERRSELEELESATCQYS